MAVYKKVLKSAVILGVFLAGGCLINKKKPLPPQVVDLPQIADCSSGCAPFETPEQLNESYMNHYGWRFEKFDTEPMRPTAQNAFKAYARFAPGKRILDIGAGPGHYAAGIAAQGFLVDCIDPHAAFKKYCENKGLPFVCTSVLDYKPAAAYDVVVGIGWPFSHVRPENAAAVLKHIATKLLVSKGIAILTFFIGCGVTYEDPMKVGHKRYFVHYSEEECRKLLGQWFEVIAVKEHYLNSIQKDARIFVCRNK